MTKPAVLPLVYVCTPLTDPEPSGVERNIGFAESICRMVSLSGGAPYAPHLLLPRFLDDNEPRERDMGIQAGLRVLTHCDELWAVIPPWRTHLSNGMKCEVEAAMAFGIPVRIFHSTEQMEPHLNRLQAGQVMRRVA